MLTSELRVPTRDHVDNIVNRCGHLMTEPDVPLSGRDRPTGDWLS
jgi:hypothetical protein